MAELKPEDIVRKLWETDPKIHAEVKKTKDLGCPHGRMLFKVGNHVITKSSAFTNDRKIGTVVGFTKTKVKVSFDHLIKIQCVDSDKIELDWTFHL
jgi:hypothetical protein